MRASAFAIALSALAACTYPYDPPVIEEGLGFRGIDDYLDTQTENYLDKTPVRVVLTHGMCSGRQLATGRPDDTNWVARRATQMAAALGAPLSLGPAPDLKPSETYPPDARARGVPAVERYDFTFAAPKGPVEASFLIWGRHVDAYRKALEYENGRGDGGPGEKPIRASLNARLKTDLMNGCLIDAVVYLGESGDSIRHHMRWALCDILGGGFTSTRSAGRADTDASCIAAQGFGGPAVLIAESLGSTILFDAFNGISPSAARAGTATVGSIFMDSNQFPFLRQGNQPRETPRSSQQRTAGVTGSTRGTDSLSEFLSLLPSFRTLDGVSERAQLVAFTDPNDILGYRLTQDDVQGSNVALRNVLVSNTATVLGTIANPIEAHRNTKRSQVFDLIANGHP